MSSILRIESSRANGAKSRGPVTPTGKLAALANSAKSTGPVTPEGKAASSRNALRHGILAESILLDNESAESFCEILSALHEELEPAPGIESRFVETMAIAEWRRLRLMCLEKEQINIEIRRQRLLSEESADLANLNPASNEPGPEPAESNPLRLTALAFRALCDNSRAQELLIRSEARYDRQYQRALHAFRAHREARKREEKEARRRKSTQKSQK